MLLSKDRVFKLMDECFKGLQESGSIDTKSDLNEQTVLLGEGSNLDSLGFVSFVSDLEDKISKDLGHDFYIVLNNIEEFDVSTPSLSASKLSDYVLEAVKNEG